jgi:hypothetical protein
MAGKDDQQTETTETVVYPGRLTRYHALMAQRKEAEAENAPDLVGFVIAEEIAGLAYILDGIRYAARNQ